MYIEQFQKHPKKFGSQICPFGGSKWAKMGKINIFYKLKDLGRWFFLPIPPFSNPLSPFKVVSNISNNWLPQILGLGVPKLVKNGQKWSRIMIFPKLKELGCWFLFLSPHFPTHWVHLRWFQPFPIVGYPKFWAWGCQNGSKLGQNG